MAAAFEGMDGALDDEDLLKAQSKVPILSSTACTMVIDEKI